MKGDSDIGLPSLSNIGRRIITSFSPVCNNLLNNASRCSALACKFGKEEKFLRSASPNNGELGRFLDQLR